MTLHAKMTMPDFQWYPLGIYISMFLPIKSFPFKSNQRIACLSEAMEKLSELNKFRVR